MTAGHSCLYFLLSSGLLFLARSVEVLQEDIAFPSGITIKPIAEDARYPDLELTGSRLFSVGFGEVTTARRLSLNIAVGSWKDPSQNIFRAHPVFTKCLQKVWTEVQNSGKNVRLAEGFLAAGGGSVRDRHRKSGTGAALGFAASESNKDFQMMAKSFLRHCPPLFGPLGRDLGLIIEPEVIFAYMTGTKSNSLQSVTVAGNGQFGGVNINTWVRQCLDEVTQPLSVPACPATTPVLSSGGIFPSGASSNPSDTVGPRDKIVRRTSDYPDREDFIRLIQFPSDNVEFVIPASATSCPSGGGIRGNGPTTRCGPRLMSPRMFMKTNALQKMVQTSLSSKLRIVEGYSQENVGTVNQLRNEARQVKIQLVSSNTAARLGVVSKLARCAGFDFIKHGGDHLILAVAKQLKKLTKPVQFPKGALIPVAAPQSDWNELYKLPDGFAPTDFPLFDRNYRSNDELEEGTSASLFISKEEDVRYFRISILLVKCLSEVILWENRGKKETDPKISVRPVRAYISNMQQSSLLNPIDIRLDKHNLGLAMHLHYVDKTQVYNVWRLADTMATVCPTIIYNQDDTASKGRHVGLGVYSDGVYIDIREKTKVWFECETNCDRLTFPSSSVSLKNELKTRIAESQANRIIQPNNWDVACTFDNPPKPQDPSFVHQHSEATKRVRRATRGSDDCLNTAAQVAFCDKSSQQRQREVQRIWEIIKMKHLVKDEASVKAALDGCLLGCSKCTSGHQWDSKVEHCNNLVHWIPFGFLNEREGVVTNVYPRSDAVARMGACEAGEHCLDLTPIFGLFAPAMNSKFRPEEGKANKELVYDPVQNPSPLMNLISRLYGLYARGRVNLWLRSEADIAGMEDTIKTIFVYDKLVKSVHLNILDKSAEGTIISTLEGRLDAWRTMVCPKNTRIALTPYTIGMATIAESFAYNLRHRIIAEEEGGAGLRPNFI